MLEILLTLGLIGILLTIVIYNTREIYLLKGKVDFIYNNIKVTMQFINDNNKKS